MSTPRPVDRRRAAGPGSHRSSVKAAERTSAGTLTVLAGAGHEAAVVLLGWPGACRGVLVVDGDAPSPSAVVDPAGDLGVRPRPRASGVQERELLVPASAGRFGDGLIGAAGSMTGSGTCSTPGSSRRRAAAQLLPALSIRALTRRLKDSEQDSGHGRRRRRRGTQNFADSVTLRLDLRKLVGKLLTRDAHATSH
jgi:hypothetical protein